MRNQIILHYGELTLKGSNRHTFVKRLRKNIRKKLLAHNLQWEVITIHDRMFIEVPSEIDIDIDFIVSKLAQVPGVAWLSKVFWFSKQKYDFFETNADFVEIEKIVEKLANETYETDKTFSIRVKRSNKNYPLTSAEAERKIATKVLQNTEWTDVNLKHADQFFYVDISPRGIAVHTNKIKALGGLPVSATGKVMCLLSGGFDSPIAAYQMAKRGCNVDFIHFTANNIQPNKLETYKVSRIAKRISEFVGRVRLYLVPYTHFDLALMDKDLEYDLIMFRRFMARVAEKLAENLHSQSLVTGDNLGQVASQTMENMISMTKSIEMPILRPLLTYNKEEIVELSRKLELFDLCTEPYKDCCALISNSPRTKSKPEKLDSLESKYFEDYQELIEVTLAEKQVIAYQFGNRIEYT